MPCPLVIVSHSVRWINIVNTNSQTKQQTMQIQISWLLQKPTDLDQHCLQRKAYQGAAKLGSSTRWKGLYLG